MHIVHIYKDYHPVLGGIENHIRVLAEGLVARGHRVTVLVTSTSRIERIEHRPNLTIIKAPRLLHVASTPLSTRMFDHARRLGDVDVIDLHFPYPPGDLVALAVPNQPPLVITYHSDIVRQQAMLRLYSPLLEWTLRRAACIVPTTPNYIESSPWLRAHADRCVASPLSVDLARFDHPDPLAVQALRARYRAPLLLFVGRLRYYKGLHYLLDALPQMRREARLLLVGSGPEAAALAAQVARLHLHERVFFAGEVDDASLPAAYAAADVFVLPSHLRSEAFGIVQLEAQAARLPVVCTELATGTSYITRHGSTGFVVPPANPPALARALDVLVANPELAQRMGRNGRRRAEEEFSHQHMIIRKEQIYLDVVRRARQN